MLSYSLKKVKREKWRAISQKGYYLHLGGTWRSGVKFRGSVTKLGKQKEGLEFL